MKLSFTVGTGADENADATDKLPVNFTLVPKPNYSYMNMTDGLTKYGDGTGIDRGGLYVQTDKLKGHFRVSGNNLIKVENGKSEVIDTHIITVMTMQVTAVKSNLLLGESVDVLAEITGGEGIGEATFESDEDPDIVTLGVVGNACKVTSVAHGTAKIKITGKDANSEVSTTIEINVSEAGISVSPKTAKIAPEKDVTIKAITTGVYLPDLPVWTCEESPGFVTLTPSMNSCKVTGVAAGVANVVATYTRGDVEKTATSVVTVEAVAPDFEPEYDDEPTPLEPDPIDVTVESDKSEVSGIKVSGSGYAVMVITNNNLAITTDRKQWLYNVEHGIRLNPAGSEDENLGTPIDTCFMNERLIDISPDETTGITYIVQHAAGYDGVVKVKSFGTSDARADEIVGIGYMTGNRIIIMNRFSGEVLRDDGIETASKQYTLVREESRAFSGGLISTHCKTPFAGSWALIGGAKNESPNVHVIGNGALSPIGTSQIQSILAEYKQADFDSAWLETRARDGHNLLICQLPRHTLQFDASTKQWSILKTGIKDNVWRASHGVFNPVESKWLYGDKLGANIGYIDKSVFSQYGEAQEAMLFTPMMPMYNQVLSKIEIRTLVGRYPQAFTQRAWISTTNHGGMTYGNEGQRDIATGLSYGNRFLWQNLGMANGEISFRFRIISKYPTAIGESMEIS